MAMMRFTRLLNRSGLTLVSLAKKAAIGLVVVVIVFFIGRIYESQRGPALHRWHTWTANEMTADEIDHATFAEYQTREEAIFRDMKSNITDTLSDDEKTAINRFYAQSLVYPDKFQPDWNRSFVLLPQGKPRGAVVLLHGLTDSPYSVHYLAQRYQQQGFIAVAPRLPIIYAPFMQMLFGTAALPFRYWVITFIIGFVMFLIVEVEKPLTRKWRTV